MKTILITGANRGLGYTAAEKFLEAGWNVIAAARTSEKAEATAKQLVEKHNAAPSQSKNQSKNRVIPFELDVTNLDQISKLSKTLPLIPDVLFNNAGIMIDSNTNTLAQNAEEITKTFKTNTLAPYLIATVLAPHMKSGSRIINMSSGLGQLADMSDGYTGYRISKTGLNAVTKILQASFPSSAINSVCPGWCKTDMGGQHAPRSPEQGVDTVLWLATMNNPPKGGFFRDRKSIPW